MRRAALLGNFGVSTDPAQNHFDLLILAGIAQQRGQYLVRSYVAG